MAYRKMAIVVFFVLTSTSCIPAATDAELQQMCENLVKMRGEIDNSTEKELIAKVEERFVKEKKRLEDWKARDLKGWDDELAAKLAKTEKEEEKEALKQEYEKKKTVTASKHDPGIAALAGKKKAAIEDAKKKVVENKAAWGNAVTDCVSQSKSEGINQQVAQCRIKAETKDKYWNACR